jgi:TolB protein
MNSDGSDEHVLTSGPADEGPSWAPSGRDLVFQRSSGTRRSLYRVSLAGGEPQQIATPQDASDPDWSGPMD